MSATMPNHTHIVHRNREQPAPDPGDAPIDQIGFYLDKYKIKEALHVFYHEDTLQSLSQDSDFMWDLIPLICKRLRGLNQFRFRVFEGCEKMLCRISIDRNCNPKEVLISLLSEINPSNDDDNVFRAMVRPLEGALFRMKYPSPRCENLIWTLSVLSSHINNIDLPSTKRFIEVLPLLIGFVEDFIEIEDARRCHFGPVKTILSLINYPLVFLDINNTPELRSIAIKCLRILVRFRPDIYSLIYSKKEQDDWIQRLQESEEMGMFSNDEILVSLASASYIHHCINLVYNQDQQNYIRFVPPVYTPEHTLVRHLPLILALLDKTERLVYEKGLTLLEALLRFIPKESLDSNFIDILDDSLLDQQLFKIMVFCPTAALRKFAFILFTRLCDCLNQECRYRLLKSIVKQSNMSAGIRGACVDLYRKYFIEAHQDYMGDLKEIKSECFATTEKQSSESELYSLDCVSNGVGTYPPPRRKSRIEQRFLALADDNLNEFLHVCAQACIPEAHQTDVLESYELILATLNFLRFLKLSNQAPNTIDHKKDFMSKRNIQTFLNPLRSAISLNIGDLRMHQKETIDQNKCSANREASDLEMVKPDSNVALCRLDLIQSIFALTSDLFDK